MHASGNSKWYISVTHICHDMSDNKEYTCKRCGYATCRKHNLQIHLQPKKFVCQPLLEDIDPKVLIDELTQTATNIDGAFSCTFCSRRFNARSNLSTHSKRCRQRVIEQTDIDRINDQVNELSTKLAAQLDDATHIEMKNKELIAMLKQLQKDKKQDQKHYSTLQQQINNLQLEVGILKNKKTESFYQSALERFKFSGCTHQRLLCGITDITTDQLHAEIKVFSDWKEAVGQLLTYNQEMPRNQLHVYLFGQYNANCKKVAITALTNLNIQPFEIKVINDQISITDLVRGTIELYGGQDDIIVEEASDIQE